MSHNMISHQFIEGRSKTDFLQYTLQITTDSLQGESLIEVIDYLIDNVHLIYQKQPTLQEEVMWPIKINLKDELVLSESSFWKHIFENVTNSYEYLDRYISVLCELAKKDEYGYVLMSDEYQHHGGMAFNQYWLWSVENPYPENSELKQAIRCFVYWLSKNDLDVETTQDDIISLIIENFSNVDFESLSGLITVRLNGGQRTEKGFDYLLKALSYHDKQGSHIMLRTIIDKLTSAEFIIPSAAETLALYQKLCAVTYGSNKQATQVVMNYVKSKFDESLWPMHGNDIKKVRYLQNQADIYWQQVTSQDRYIDTSFHLFDTHTRKWIDYSEREDG